MVLAEFFIFDRQCCPWQPEVLQFCVVSDAVTALRDGSIPLTLAYFVARRRDVLFNWIFLLFIYSCRFSKFISSLSYAKHEARKTAIQERQLARTALLRKKVQVVQNERGIKFAVELPISRCYCRLHQRAVAKASRKTELIAVCHKASSIEDWEVKL